MEWEYLFEEKILNRGRLYVSDVKNLKKINDKIICNVSGSRDYYVTATIVDDELKDISCNCHYPFNCKHEAALLYYLEKNKNIITQKEEDNTNKDSVETLIDHMDVNTLRKFLKKELKINDKLKEDFINEFKDKRVDKSYYEKIIDGIFENGKGKEFNLHGYYDLDYIDNSLLKFLDEDIYHILSLEEEDIACDLLNKIMDKIDDEMYLNSESWFDIADKYQEYAFDILNSNKLSEDQRATMEYHLSKTLEFI